MLLSRKGLSAVLLLFAASTFCVVLLAAPPSEAQQDLNCSDFDFQEEAQDELESDPDDPNNLDNDNDGIACETLPRRGGDGGTPGNAPANAASDLNCADFDSQEEAQAEFDEDPDDPNGLDADDDGIACESLSTGDGDEDGTDDEADEPTVPGAQQDQGESSAASQSSARAGGALAQSSSEERTDRRDRVIRGTIPKKPLPPTGGTPLYVVATGSILAGMVLLGLGLVIRRGR